MEEKVIRKFHPSRLAFMKSYAASLLLLALSAGMFLGTLTLGISAIESYSMYVGGFLVLIALALIVISEFRVRDDTYTITDYRITESSGLLSVKESSTHWEKISNVELTQSFLKRMMRIGTITIESTGGDERPEVVLRDVRNAPEVKKLIDQKMLESEGSPKISKDKKEDE